MGRLIDADRFLSQIEDQYMEHDITREKYMDLEDRIAQQETVDAMQWTPFSTHRMPKEGEKVLLRYIKNGFEDYAVTSRRDYNLWTGIGREITPIGFVSLEKEN